MKTIVALAIAAAIGSALIIGLVVERIAFERSVSEEVSIETSLQEILHNTFDNGRGSVYIRVDNPLAYDNEKSLIELMDKKWEWERESPNKKISAMSLHIQSSSGTSTVHGLLLHYELK